MQYGGLTRLAVTHSERYKWNSVTSGLIVVSSTSRQTSCAVTGGKTVVKCWPILGPSRRLLGQGAASVPPDAGDLAWLAAIAAALGNAAGVQINP